MASLLFAEKASAALIDRGGGLIYDTDLNVTWLQDVNPRGFGSNWSDTVAWTNAFVYQGYEDWRLPHSPTTAQGFVNEGELGRLYYTTLGNPAGGPLTQTEPFVDFPARPIFWLDAAPPSAGSAWSFEFNQGFQNASFDGQAFFAWPVRDGDSHPLPEPAASVLVGACLVCGRLWRRSTRRQRAT